MLIPHLIMDLQYLNIRGASLQGKSSQASPETILWLYLFGKCRKIPGQEFEHTVLKLHESEIERGEWEREREREGEGWLL